MGRYTEQAMTILENDARFYPPGIYTVTVAGKFLSDTDTLKLRLKIEDALHDKEVEATK